MKISKEVLERISVIAKKTSKIFNSNVEEERKRLLERYFDESLKKLVK